MHNLVIVSETKSTIAMFFTKIKVTRSIDLTHITHLKAMPEYSLETLLFLHAFLCAPPSLPCTLECVCAHGDVRCFEKEAHIVKLWLVAWALRGDWIRQKLSSKQRKKNSQTAQIQLQSLCTLKCSVCNHAFNANYYEHSHLKDTYFQSIGRGTISWQMEQQHDLNDIKLIMLRQNKTPSTSYCSMDEITAAWGSEGCVCCLLSNTDWRDDDIWVMQTTWGGGINLEAVSDSPPPHVYARLPAETQQGSQVILNTNHSPSASRLTPHPPAPIPHPIPKSASQWK